MKRPASTSAISRRVVEAHRRDRARHRGTGAGPQGDERALVFHFDRHGGPRWLRGEGTRRAGEAVIVLEHGNAEGRLTYAFRGACGAVAGSASLVLPTVGTGPAPVFPATALLNAGGGACY